MHFLLRNFVGCLINNGEKEMLLRRSQQQRNYLMNHHESSTQGSQNRRRIGHQSISRDQRNRIGKGFTSDSKRRARLEPKKGGMFVPKKKSLSFKHRVNNRHKTLFDPPECNPSTGCVNITRTFATLGRTASMSCLAKNLVGQKTVSNANLGGYKYLMICD